MVRPPNIFYEEKRWTVITVQGNILEKPQEVTLMLEWVWGRDAVRILRSEKLVG